MIWLQSFNRYYSQLVLIPIQIITKNNNSSVQLCTTTTFLINLKLINYNIIIKSGVLISMSIPHCKSIYWLYTYINMIITHLLLLLLLRVRVSYSGEAINL